jgi:hypothetical protein
MFCLFAHLEKVCTLVQLLGIGLAKHKETLYQSHLTMGVCIGAITPSILSRITLEMVASKNDQVR